MSASRAIPVAPPPMPARHEAGPLRRRLQSALDAVDVAFDRIFPAACNPWRSLGSLAFLLFWVVAATGIWVYVGFDTRSDGAHASVERLSSNAFPLGSLARGLHRYASDALVAITLMHVAREWVRGRYAHFRRFSWTAGVVALWLLFASGIGGFWLVWDQLAQYSLIATMEWLDALPLFGGTLMRNFVTNDAVSDRLFSLLIFLHIGLPLALLATMWVHVQRLGKPATAPPRSLATGTIGALVVLSLVRPVVSAMPADIAVAPQAFALDWFYLGVHAFADATSPVVLWVAVLGATALLAVLPWASAEARAPRPTAALVDAAHCNGCARCFADCPYAAIAMQPRGATPSARLAVVDHDLCAGCGICAGACPSSTPFTSNATLASGIDMPQMPLNRLRRQLERALARFAAGAGARAKIVVFGCPPARGGADLAGLADEDTATFELLCAGQLPPSFVEYALRTGADGVLVTGCREGDCDFRLGNRWTDERLSARRAPWLRRSVPIERVHVAWAGRGRERELAQTVAEFRAELGSLASPKRNRPKRFDVHENARSS